MKRTSLPEGKFTYEKLATPLLDQINALYIQGTITEEQANKQAEDLRDRLARELKGLPQHIVFNQENYAILGEFNNPSTGSYWKEVYGRRKRIIDRRTAYYSLRRAIEAVGNLSLLTATEQEIQEAIDNHNYPDNKQRKLVSGLMPILTFIGRKDVTLEKARPEEIDPRHLTYEEFCTLSFEDPIFKTLCFIAFTSGLRLGEIFAVKPDEYTADFVQVNRQLDITMTLRPGKNRGKRKAFLIENGKQHWDDWFQIPEEKRLTYRKAPIFRWIRTICEKQFPGHPEKSLVFHDLRHSYAIYLCTRSVPIDFVAKSMGNSVVVCEKHYQGKTLTSGTIDAISAILRK